MQAMVRGLETTKPSPIIMVAPDLDPSRPILSNLDRSWPLAVRWRALTRARGRAGPVHVSLLGDRRSLREPPHPALLVSLAPPLAPPPPPNATATTTTTTSSSRARGGLTRGTRGGRFLENVARMPYLSYNTMLALYEALGWWRASSDARRVHFAEEWNEVQHQKIMEALGGDSAWIDRFLGRHAALFYLIILNHVRILAPAP